MIKKTAGPLNMQLEIFNLWQSRGKKWWKVYGLVEEKIHKVYIYSHSSHFFGIVISKTTAAAEETVAWEGGGSLPDDQRALLETPG